jgi:hypothetical protein
MLEKVLVNGLEGTDTPVNAAKFQPCDARDSRSLGKARALTHGRRIAPCCLKAFLPIYIMTTPRHPQFANQGDMSLCLKCVCDSFFCIGRNKHGDDFQPMRDAKMWSWGHLERFGRHQLSQWGQAIKTTRDTQHQPLRLLPGLCVIVVTSSFFRPENTFSMTSDSGLAIGLRYPQRTHHLETMRLMGSFFAGRFEPF